MSQTSWRLVSTNNCPKEGLFRHSVCVDEENSRLFVFGGEDDNNLFVKQAYLLDLLTMTWTDLTMRLKEPIQIDSHSCVFYGGSFYIYGGNDSSTDFDSVVVYRIKVSPYGIDMETIFEDSVLSNQELPDPRREHTAQLIMTKEHGPEMLIYGGRSRMTPKKVLGDIWAFSLKSYDWRCVSDSVPPRCCHCSCYDMDNNRIIIFGGRNEKHLYCFDTFELSLPKFEFQELKCKTTEGSMIGKRELSSCVYYSGGLYVAGGWCFGQSKNDIWLLDLAEKEWMVYEENVTKEKRRGHSCFMFNNQMYMLGGKTMRNSNDLVSVKLMK